MITEIRLVSNDGASTARFWSAIFNVPAEDLGDGRWRVTPVAGPTVTVNTASVVEVISRYSDMTVSVDSGALDRLRALGFDVSAPGEPMQAVDVNGCDNTVHMVVRSWDGVTDVDWEEPSDAEKERIRALPTTATTGEVRLIETAAVDDVAAFLGVWFDVTPELALPSGVVRIIVGDTLFRVEPAEAADRQWIPLGARDYAAVVERCEEAGFTAIPSPTHPQTAGHIDIDNVTFLLAATGRGPEPAMRDDAYYQQFSAAVEAGDYTVAGPLELGPAARQSDLEWLDPDDPDNIVERP
ncbi:hypothetical protein [Mycobacterium aquaticum]|uniref:hypothetical protein n=1 Tax=Mycobacterium aquaticum TaxID=1927124 RepID=UPI001B8002CC|nr:hypothetical protein [Mycobacterium aquaticum]